MVMTAAFQTAIFNDEDKAREALEAVRWPDGPVCPHCENAAADKIAKVEGKKHSHRSGLYYCNECQGQFTVTVGTVFERSKIPLSKWWLAVHLLNSSKKGFSAHQLHRTLKVTYKTAWFMMHRIREAMRTGGLAPMGGGGKTVEADETYIGRLKGQPIRRGPSSHKNTVLTLVERGGSARSFHVDGTRYADLAPIIREHIARESALMTDEAVWYKEPGRRFSSHETVRHGQDEYVRGHVHTNTVEGFYSIFKRGMKGVYQHCAEKHPEVADRSKRFAGNNLACGNCHLQAGTKKFGVPLFGLFGEFPLYSARLGAQITIEERLNSCMTRSMNGRPLPVAAPEMQAMVAYIKFLSTGVAPGQRLPGLGVGKMPELDRAADPARGEAGYATACVACHGPNGAGIRRSLPTTDLGYMVPPLWGGDSFNDGAGMARLITAANFLHFNMPHGVDYTNPQLSPEQAWDIAAYVISQPRPHKAGLDKDFPDRLEKPVDTPYGPYADGFSEQQHKYGPFAPIRAAIAKLKAEQKGAPAPAPR
jgi:thiosulfate dehydrogenase